VAGRTRAHRASLRLGFFGDEVAPAQWRAISRISTRSPRSGHKRRRTGAVSSPKTRAAAECHDAPWSITRHRKYRPIFIEDIEVPAGRPDRSFARDGHTGNYVQFSAESCSSDGVNARRVLVDSRLGAEPSPTTEGASRERRHSKPRHHRLSRDGAALGECPQAGGHGVRSSQRRCRPLRPARRDLAMLPAGARGAATVEIPLAVGATTGGLVAQVTLRPVTSAGDATAGDATTGGSPFRCPPAGVTAAGGSDTAGRGATTAGSAGTERRTSATESESLGSIGPAGIAHAPQAGCTAETDPLVPAPVVPRSGVPLGDGGQSPRPWKRSASRQPIRGRRARRRCGESAAASTAIFLGVSAATVASRQAPNTAGRRLRWAVSAGSAAIALRIIRFAGGESARSDRHRARMPNIASARPGRERSEPQPVTRTPVSMRWIGTRARRRGRNVLAGWLSGSAGTRSS